MFIRTPYNYDTDQASFDSGLCCTDPSMTQQQFQDECDINTIMQQFKVTGQLPVSGRMPEYADYSDAVTDYQTAMNAIREAKENFMSLPSRVRERFHNDPQELLDFVMDKDNQAEAERLGLTTPKEKPNTTAPALTTPKEKPDTTAPAKPPATTATKD